MHGSICCRWTRGQGGTPWCARLVGFDPKYKFQREFIKGVYDYSYSSKYDRARPIYVYFAVSPGIYQIYDNVNRSRSRYYFVVVSQAGDANEIQEDEVIECLKNITSA